MERTELAKMTKEKRLAKIKKMNTNLLFEELDDTIQFDMMGMGTTDWTTYTDKKVYVAIINELKTRLYKYEHEQ